MTDLKYLLKVYLRERPLFLSLIRAKEAQLFQKYLPLKKPVLDVGCGDGFFASIAFCKGSDPLGSDPVQIDIGLDVKDSRIGEARKLGIYKTLVVYDGGKLPFPDNSFATVVSNCVLEHIPDIELTLNEIKRVLKPGGLFLTTVVAKLWEEYFLGNLLLGDVYKRWMRKKQVHKNMYTRDEWRNIFIKSGLQIKDEIGYLDKTAVRFIDLFHYLSIPNLVTYKLFGSWVLWKGIINFFPIKRLSQLVEKDISSTTSGNLFFAAIRGTVVR